MSPSTGFLPLLASDKPTIDHNFLLKRLLSTKYFNVAGVLCCSGIFEDTFPFSAPALNLNFGGVSLENENEVSFNGVPVILCDQTAKNGVVHGIDQFVPEVLHKYGIARRDKLWMRLLQGSNNFRHR